MSLSEAVLSFFFALLLSGILTAILIILCWHYGWLFHPRSDRWSKSSVAKFGGVPIILCFLLMSRLLPVTAGMQEILILTAVMAGLGLWDDTRPLAPGLKLIAQISCAILATHYGVFYQPTSNVPINYCITVIWIVGVTNSFNLLDNMDGLSAGIAIIASLNLLALAGSDGYTVFLLPFSGALFGFLLFNFVPAKIFMGDAGSLSIGFFIACMSVLATQKLTSVMSILFIPIFVLFLPLFDTALVSITRRLNGRAISAGARDHSSHRLVLLGMTEREAVLTLYSIAVMVGLVGLLSSRLWPEAGNGVLYLFLVAATLFWLYLAKLELPEDWISRTNVATLVIPLFLQSLRRKASLMLGDAVILVLSLYLAFLLRFDGLYGGLSLFLFLCAATLTIKLPLLAFWGAYKGKHRTASIRELYPTFKASILGTIFLVTSLTFITRFNNLSRAVLMLDMLVSTCLLVIVRVADSVFDDVLRRPVIDSRLVLAGNESLEFFRHYFAWKEPRAALVGVVTAMPLANYNNSLPAIAFPELPTFLINQAVSDVYLLPDCEFSQGAAILNLCTPLGIVVHSLEVENTILTGSHLLNSGSRIIERLSNAAASSR